MDDDPFDELRRGLRGEVAGDEHGRRMDVRHLLAGGVTTAVLAFVVLLVTAMRPAGEPSPSTASTPTIRVTDEAETTTTLPTAQVWPAEPVEVIGNEVRTQGHRWTVGEPGDLVAVGDWDCDGAATPAVLRPTTGRLHLFEAWATADAATTAAPGPRVPPEATSFETAGCGRATIRTATGVPVEVDTRSPQR